MDKLALIFGVMIAGCLGYGIAMFFFSYLLNKYNNIVDKKGDNNLYTIGIEYTAKADNIKVNPTTAFEYCKMHMPLNVLKHKHEEKGVYLDPAAPVRRYMGNNSAAEAAEQEALAPKTGLFGGMAAASGVPVATVNKRVEHAVSPDENAPLSDWALTRKKAAEQATRNEGPVFNQPSIDDEIDARFENNQNR